jgi:hypothetical protein
VLFGEVAGIADADDAVRRVMPDDEGRKGDRGRNRFQRPRGHVDDQPPDLATADPLKPPGDCFDMPGLAGREGGEDFMHEDSKFVAQQRPLHPALCDLLAAHVAMETINFVHTGSLFTISKTMAVYLPTMEIGFNYVLRLPGCSACGSHAERDDKELFFGFEMLAQPQTVSKVLKRT